MPGKANSIEVPLENLVSIAWLVHRSMLKQSQASPKAISRRDTRKHQLRGNLGLPRDLGFYAHTTVRHKVWNLRLYCPMSGTLDSSNQAWNISTAHKPYCQSRSPDRCSVHFSRIGRGLKKPSRCSRPSSSRVSAQSRKGPRSQE